MEVLLCSHDSLNTMAAEINEGTGRKLLLVFLAPHCRVISQLRCGFVRRSAKPLRNTVLDVLMWTFLLVEVATQTDQWELLGTSRSQSEVAPS